MPKFDASDVNREKWSNPAKHSTALVEVVH